MTLEENQELIDTCQTKRKGYHECPNCGKPELTIDSVSGKCNCRKCPDTKAIAQNLKGKKLSSDPPSPQVAETEEFLSAENEPDSAQMSLEIEAHSPPKAPRPLEENSQIGKWARVFCDDWSPEAIGVVEVVRGYGSSQAVEIRIAEGQPGPRLRIAYQGQWEELLSGGAER